MDEARKFLRYVQPGLIFVTLTLLWLFIVDPNETYKIFLRIIKESALAAALGGLLMSGGIGYIFEAIHHTVRSLFNTKILDHSSLINNLDIGTLTGKVDLEKSEETSTTLWCLLKDKNYIGDATYKKLESFGHITHALGTAFIASIFSLVTAAIFCFAFLGFSKSWDFNARLCFALVPGVLVIAMFYCSYRRVGILAQTVYDQRFKIAYAEYLAGMEAKKEENCRFPVPRFPNRRASKAIFP